MKYTVDIISIGYLPKPIDAQIPKKKIYIDVLQMTNNSFLLVICNAWDFKFEWIGAYHYQQK